MESAGWAGVAVSVGTFILLVPFRQVPWWRMGAVALAGVVLGAVTVWTDWWSTPLEFAVLVLAALFTAGLLWLLLMRLVDPYRKPPPKTSEHKPDNQEPEPEKPGFLRRVGLLILLAFLILKPTRQDSEPRPDSEPKKHEPEPEPERHDFLRRAGLLTLFAFLIFIGWRVALEAVSIDSLNTTVCTDTSQNVTGLYIGANNDRLYVGEIRNKLHRIAEIPRAKVERLYVGTYALDMPCPASLDSVNLPSKIAAGTTTTTGTVALKGLAPPQGQEIRLSSSSEDVQLSPSTVTVAERKSSGHFTLTQTGKEKADLVVVVSATSGAVTKTASVILNPTSSESSSPNSGSTQSGG